MLFNAPAPPAAGGATKTKNCPPPPPKPPAQSLRPSPVANCVWRCQIPRQYQTESAARAQRPAPAAQEKQAEWQEFRQPYRRQRCESRLPLIVMQGGKDG